MHNLPSVYFPFLDRVKKCRILGFEWKRCGCCGTQSGSWKFIRTILWLVVFLISSWKFDFPFFKKLQKLTLSNLSSKFENILDSVATWHKKILNAKWLRGAIYQKLIKLSKAKNLSENELTKQTKHFCVSLVIFQWIALHIYLNSFQIQTSILQWILLQGLILF